jgi:two-component system NarL family sensor kinase
MKAKTPNRRRVARELHDHITQHLCAILVRSQALADKLSARDDPAKGEGIKLREMLGLTVEEVERISRNLHPSVLDELGLVAVLRDAAAEFTERTGVSLELACVKMTERLPADTEVTLYRILQETLKNVEKHAGARHVQVHLTLCDGVVQLAIEDDGIGFDPNHHPKRSKAKAGLGLLSMRERAAYAGGRLEVKSLRGAGTKIQVRIPLLRNTNAS